MKSPKGPQGPKKARYFNNFNLVERRSIRADRVDPREYLKYKLAVSCEDCSHFDPINTKCTIGYNPAHHLQARQRSQYELGGRIAFCRFIEID